MGRPRCGDVLMSEPIKIFVVIWDDGGQPNCDIYRNIPAFMGATDDRTPEDEQALKEAMQRPGESIELDSEDAHVQFRTVADL